MVLAGWVKRQRGRTHPALGYHTVQTSYNEVSVKNEVQYQAEHVP
nr:MAG TPA: hypothetical protein [Caudoviricetes sp.]